MLLVIFGIGAFMYGLMEVSFRGYTHWSMFLAGGIILCLLYYIYNSLNTKSLLLRAAIGCAVITSIEFTIGIYVNRVFSMNVWDYSSQPFNVMGQICLLFSVLWFFLSVPISYLTTFLNKKLN